MRKSKRYIGKHQRLLAKPQIFQNPDAWFRRPWGKYLISCLASVVAETALVLFLLYGPVDFFRDTLITSAMSTLSHKYYATTFYSEETIQEVLAKHKVTNLTTKTETDAINTEERKDDIKLREITGKGYVGYVLEISNPAWVRLGIPNNFGTKGQKIPLLIEDYNAIAGINGGGFDDPSGWGNGGAAIGTVIVDGVTIQENWQESCNIIGFNEDDVLVLGTYRKDEIEDLHLRDACEFYPFLIINGEPADIKGDGGWGIAPRTAIGQRRDGTVLFVVIDGRQLSSVGATIKQLQQVMIDEGAYNAANLDGGSSTVLYYEEEGGVVNSPSGSDRDGMRFLPNAWLVIDPETYDPPTDRPPYGER